MSSSTISEGIILVAVIIAASTISITFFNSISKVDDTNKKQFDQLQNKIDTSLKVIHAQKTGNTTVDVWVKNIGSNTFSETELDQFDILFGKTNDSISIYSLEDPLQASHRFENNKTKHWLSGETVQITVTTQKPLQQGDYYFSLNSPSGTNHKYSFSLSD